MNQQSTVSVSWLEEHLEDANVRIVDASWHLPTADRDAKAEYQNQHILGAVYFDIDQCSTAGPLPHTLPSEEDFAQYVGGLGIGDKDTIVIYDSVGLFSAARVWWMFRHFGSRTVRVLEGGLPAWQSAGLPTEQGEWSGESCVYQPTQESASRFQVADAEQVLDASNTGKKIILDARSAARFSGAEKEFRPGLRSGHIPNSKNVPFTHLLSQGFLKEDAELQAIFGAAGVDEGSRVITSCGSGVTAAVLCLALDRIGVENVALYDGSWSEWGGLIQMPVDTTVGD